MTGEEEACIASIIKKGNEIRTLKEKGNSKDEITVCVKTLLSLKEEYLKLTGKAYVPESNGNEKKEKKNEKKKENGKKKKDGKESKATSSSKETSSSSSKVSSIKESKVSNKEVKAIDVNTLRMTLKRQDIKNKDPEIHFHGSALPVNAYIMATLLQKTSYFYADLTPAWPTMIISTNDNVEYVHGDLAIARYLARSVPEMGYYGDGNVSTSKIDGWMDWASIALVTTPTGAIFSFLNEYLTLRTFFIGTSLSLADITLWNALRKHTLDLSTYIHLNRWMSFLTALKPFQGAVSELNKKMGVLKSKSMKVKKATTSTGESGSCPPLIGAIDGGVVTRFPPEPSGYLHIGHVKACMLNHYYAKRYNGKLIVRFDDTNPSKEKAEFETSIISDLAKLDIVADLVTYTSDSFPLILKMAYLLLSKDLAYMDDTPQEKMRDERMAGIDGCRRNTKMEENVTLFNAMIAGNLEGYCLRAKIDMQAKNKTMCDPVIYRVNKTPHHRTGSTYKAYPTYDFACPIVDSTEGVTHALRTTEYNDRDEQFAWMISALELRPVVIQSYARMNFQYSVLSKRKLAWFVEMGHVTGWDDPRFPTVQGVLRRGVQMEALREFILSQGSSRRITDMMWDKFWSMNKKIIDPIASRYFALSNPVKLTLTNIPKEVEQGLRVPLLPKFPEKGNKIMRFGRDLLIEAEDAMEVVIGEEFTLMRYGNVMVTAIEKNEENGQLHIIGTANPEGDFKKTKKKITWLANVPDVVHVQMIEFDHLISKAKLEEGDDFKDHLNVDTRAETEGLGDHGLRICQKDDIIQLERRGFYRVESPYVSKSRPMVLYMIPDGKAKAMSTLSTKLSHR